MQHHVEIDQSGKIERTQENTVLAFSDGVIDSTFSEQRIVFRSIGKKSPAHHKALAVYRGKDKPDQKVRARELLRLIK